MRRSPVGGCSCAGMCGSRGGMVAHAILWTALVRPSLEQDAEVQVECPEDTVSTGQGSEGGQPAAGRTADVENTVGPADLWGLIEAQKSTVFPAAYFTDLVALLEKGLETTIKNDKGGGEKGGEKGGGGGEPALFSAEELARLLQARQDFLAIQGRTLRPELTKHLEERKLQVLGHARLPADGSTMHGVQAVPEQLLSA